MSKKTAIRFHFLRPCTLPNRGPLRKFIFALFRKEKIAVKDLNIIFCDDEYLLNLNRQFLNHDFYTDILSFPLSEVNQPLVAETYISVTRVRENARANRSTIQEEVHRVIFHGILHFCGYKDKSVNDIKKMRLMENRCLKAYL